MFDEDRKLSEAIQKIKDNRKLDDEILGKPIDDIIHEEDTSKQADENNFFGQSEVYCFILLDMLDKFKNDNLKLSLFMSKMSKK